MGRTIYNDFRVQSKQSRRIDDAGDAIRGINEVNNVTVLLLSVRRQSHSTANLKASLENSEKGTQYTAD